MSQSVGARGRTYDHRYGMTLEESYAEYYGATASPARFLSAVEDLVDAAAAADAGEMGQEPM